MVDENYAKLNDSPSLELDLILSSGWKIHYFETGPVGEPVILFVHGLSESCEYWMQTINHIRMQKYRCLAIDLLGFGDSDKPINYDYSMEKQCETIQEFLTLKKINQVVYIGHSMGGIVGMALLELYPQIIKKIVLVDSPLSEPHLSDIDNRRRLLKNPEWLLNLVVFPSFKRTLNKRLFAAPTKEILEMEARVTKKTKAYAVIRALKDISRFLQKRDHVSIFKNSPIPHYYIYGTLDDVARMVKECFAGESWVMAISDVNHCPMNEAPKTFSKILVDILAVND